MEYNEFERLLELAEAVIESAHMNDPYQRVVDAVALNALEDFIVNHCEKE